MNESLEVGYSHVTNVQLCVYRNSTGQNTSQTSATNNLQPIYPIEAKEKLKIGSDFES